LFALDSNRISAYVSEILRIYIWHTPQWTLLFLRVQFKEAQINPVTRNHRSDISGPTQVASPSPFLLGRFYPEKILIFEFQHQVTTYAAWCSPAFVHIVGIHFEEKWQFDNDIFFNIILLQYV
jgi:hypothetical protein